MRSDEQVIRDELAKSGFVGRGRKRDWRRGIEALLGQAQVTAHTCKVFGVWPSSFRSGMPDYIRDYFESYGLERARVGNAPPTGAMLDNLDLANAAMMTPELTVTERAVLWAHAGNQRWKRIVARMCIPERTLRRHRNTAFATFTLSLLAVEREKKRMVA